MRVFIAGATGVLGRALLPLLLAAGHEVTATTRSPGKEDQVRAAGATPVVVDALDDARLLAAMVDARPDVVVHLLTAIPPAIDPRRWAEQFAPNDELRVRATQNLVAAARVAGVGRIVAESYAGLYARTGGAIKCEDDPLDIDAADARRQTARALSALEQAVTRTDGINGIALRLGTLYGPGTAYGPSGAMADLARHGRLPIVGSGAGVSSFVHLDDAAAAIILALEHGAPGIYNVVDDDPAASHTWIPVFAAAVGAAPPRWIPAIAARLLAGQIAVSLMTEARGASNARVRRDLSWAPVHSSWREGFRSEATPE